MDFNSSEPRNVDAARDEIYALQNVSEALSERDLIEGRRFVGGNDWEGITGTAYYDIQNTSSDKWMFIRTRISVSGGVWTQRSYQPTVDTQGTEDDIRRSRDGSVTSTATAYIDSTYTDVGSTFPRALVGGGSSTGQFEFGVREEYNTVLEPGESVLYTAEVIGSSDVNISIYSDITEVEADEV